MLFVLADQELLFEEIARLKDSLLQRESELHLISAKLKTSDELAGAVSRESALFKRERDRVIAEKYFLLSELKKFSAENYEATIEQSFADPVQLGDLFGASVSSTASSLS